MTPQFEIHGTIAKKPVTVSIQVPDIDLHVIHAQIFLADITKELDRNLPTNAVRNFEIFEYKGDLALVFDYQTGHCAWIPRKLQTDPATNAITNLPINGIRIHPTLNLNDYEWQPLSKRDFDKWIAFFRKYPAKQAAIKLLEILRDKLH